MMLWAIAFAPELVTFCPEGNLDDEIAAWTPPPGALENGDCWLIPADEFAIPSPE